MHEAALASAVAQAISERGLSGVRIRLFVSGGHADVDAFDAALRFHLAASDPEIDLDAITIEHLAEERAVPVVRPFVRGDRHAGRLPALRRCRAGATAGRAGTSAVGDARLRKRSIDV